MHSFSYPATFRRDLRGRVLVGFPDLPEAHTDGCDMREAVEEAIDYLGSAIAFRIGERSDIPVPARPKRGQRMVPVPLWIAGKLALVSGDDRARREQ
jgi:antitoxin HicB